MEFDPRLPDEGKNTSPEHPLREFALLVAGVVGVVLAVVAFAAVAVDRLVPLVPPHLEARWFAGWLAPDRDTDSRAATVQTLLDRLAAHWHDRPYPFHVGVLDEAAPNALALPGGMILVTSGLLERVASENELALVLGHELGHFRARDHLRGLGRGLAAQLVLGALGTSGELVSSLGALAGALAQRGFDRRQESQADAFGLELVHAEYGHVAGAGDFFARLENESEDASRGERRLARYLDTHPLHADRVAALTTEARAHGWATEGPLTRLALPQGGRLESRPQASRSEPKANEAQ
jgi:Zn-dependent protease with chaperone function